MVVLIYSSFNSGVTSLYVSIINLVILTALAWPSLVTVKAEIRFYTIKS